MKELLIKNSITINAHPEKVWNVLVDPKQTKKYMFGCETISDWKVGSSLLWRVEYEGNELIAVKGVILALEPNKLLSYTVFDPNNKTMDDVVENYLTVTYELEAVGDKTVFNVTQGDYNKVAEGERRYKESYNNGEGWNPIMIEIKKLAEENN